MLVIFQKVDAAAGKADDPLGAEIEIGIAADREHHAAPIVKKLTFGRGAAGSGRRKADLTAQQAVLAVQCIVQLKGFGAGVVFRGRGGFFGGFDQ